ncbi:MAG: FG-GAP repeat protein [Candidatus Magnetomorum sp.]|nr:FG-GAP repeat protein [Candidatus Magnetomorum sp.]
MTIQCKYLMAIVMILVVLPGKALAFNNIPSSDVDSSTSDEIKVAPEDCVTDDQFGRAVGVSGKYAIVGAYGNDDQARDAGAAYILYYTDSQWHPTQKLIAMDGEAFDYFGVSVSIDQDQAVVGAYGDDDHGNKSGSAYIFQKNDTTWNEWSKIKAHDGKGADYFGCSVAISGKYIIVGAYGANDYGSHSGAAYIFVSEANGVYEQQKLIAGDAGPFDFFGYSVSISGDYAIVGAYGVQYRGEKSGAAYIFERHGDQWRQLIKLAPSDGSQNDYFGRSVSISGEHVIIGAIGKDDFGQDSGAAYIFKRSGYYWSRKVKIIPQNIRENNCFGASVNISNNYAIIGAHGDDMYGKRTGAAYVYQLNKTTWDQIAMFRPKDGSDGDYFGYSVAISGSQVIAGAYGNDANGEKSGAAYFYGIFLSE